VSQSDGLKLERPGLEHGMTAGRRERDGNVIMPPDGTVMARGNLEIL